MLNEQIMAAVSVQRKIYASLTEISELTGELSQAVSRSDQVSVRLFLSMRREEIERLLGFQALLRRQCAQLPSEEGALLRRLLFGNSPPATVPAGGEVLLQLIEKNRALLDRICKVDQVVSRRLGGRNSFYVRNGG